MLNAFRIDSSRFRADPECTKKGLDDLVTTAALLGQFLSGFGQEYATVWPLRDETLLRETFQHFCDRGLGDAETGRNIDLACLAAIIDQVRNQLHIVLHELEPASLSRLAEPLNVRFGIDEEIAGVRLLCPLQHYGIPSFSTLY